MYKSNKINNSSDNNDNDNTNNKNHRKIQFQKRIPKTLTKIKQAKINMTPKPSTSTLSHFEPLKKHLYK